MSNQQQRSLRHEYDIYVREEIEHYKESVSRSTLLSIGDEAVTAISDQAQMGLTELLLCEEVDRIISKRLRLPTYTTWRKRRLRLLETYRRPEHWNLSPHDVVVREVHASNSARVLVASPADEGPALYLAANGCDVTAVDEQPEMVKRVLTAAGAAGLAVRGCVGSLGEWSPSTTLSAVICSPAAFDGFTAHERERVIQILQSATRDGGVHLVQTIVAGDNALTVDELISSYSGWEVNIDIGAPGSRPTFIARKASNISN